MAETDKNTRILELHTMLTRGECLRKKDLAQRFGVTEKSIQRDIEDLRDFFTRSGEPRVLAYDAKERAYVLRADKALALTNSEVLAVAKILLESRSMVKDEMFPILDKLDVDFHDMSRKSEPDGKGKHKRAERAHLCFLQELERSGKRIYSPCFRNETVLGV